MLAIRMVCPTHVYRYELDWDTFDQNFQGHLKRCTTARLKFGLPLFARFHQITS